MQESPPGSCSGSSSCGHNHDEKDNPPQSAAVEDQTCGQQNEIDDCAKVDPEKIRQVSCAASSVLTDTFEIHFEQRLGDVEKQTPVSGDIIGIKNNSVKKVSLEKHDSNKPFSIFSQRKKICIIILSTCGCLFSPMTTNIYYPAITTIANDLHQSISKINLTITTYMIFQGITPSFISAITDTYGRRPAYVIGMIIYLGANIGLGLNKTYGGLLALRCVQSAGSSGMVTLQQAIIGDIITSAERGRYIGFTAMSSILAPSIAPIIGGAISQHFGWHAIFWFLLIAAGAYMVPLVLFFPETSRKLVADGSIPPPRWNRPLWNVIKSRVQTKSRSAQKDQVLAPDNKKFQWPNPFRTFRIFTQKEQSIMLAFIAITYATFCAVTTSLTVQFHEIYGLNDQQQGLLFIPQAVGTIIAAFTNSFALDWNYKRHALRLGLPVDKKKQQDLTNFPIERVRLEIGLPMFLLASLTMITYGWVLEYKVRIEVPIFLLVVLGASITGGFSTLNVINIDINRHQVSTASAAANLARCLVGAGATAAVNPIILAIGRGWTFTIAAFLQIASIPLLLLCIKYGMKWRAEMAAKLKNQVQ